MKIIIVEDDALIADQIQTCSEGLGHEVLASFETAESALEFIASNRPDFVFMDIDLNGGMTGIQCAMALKSRYDIRSLFVTAQEEPEIIEEATSLNPLNYLVKPFYNRDIKAALALAGVALKKHKPIEHNSSIASLGAYTFNFDYSTLRRKDIIVKLAPQNLKLITLLFKNVGNTVSSDELISYIWEGRSTSVNDLRQLVSRTNKKLDDIKIASDIGNGYYLHSEETL